MLLLLVFGKREASLSSLLLPISPPPPFLQLGPLLHPHPTPCHLPAPQPLPHPTHHCDRNCCLSWSRRSRCVSSHSAVLTVQDRHQDDAHFGLPPTLIITAQGSQTPVLSLSFLPPKGEEKKRTEQKYAHTHTHTHARTHTCTHRSPRPPPRKHPRTSPPPPPSTHTHTQHVDPLHTAILTPSAPRVINNISW